MKKLLISVLAAGALLLCTAPGSGQAGGQERFPIAGLVPHVGAGATFAARTLAATGHGPLVYHGDWTMRTNTTYAIYWVPSGSSVSPQYESLINGYFADIAAASGTTGNVYSVATQYYDTTGAIAYSSTFGGSYVDTTPFPGSGCADGKDPVCLTDAQLETEIESVINLQHWPAGQTSVFFVMTPANVGICADGTPPSSGGQCVTNAFCAYHSGFNGTTGPVIYAVEPYEASFAGCAYPNSPNNDAADATINTISHEHMEAITDPTGYGWYSNDGSGDEIGDLCSWNFGAALGSTPYGQYNQVINGHYYWLQTEYSNASTACVQNYTQASSPPPPTTTPPPTNVSLPLVSGTAGVGQLLATSTGSWTGSPTGYTYQWQECAADGTGCTDIAGASGATYKVGTGEVGHTVRSEIVASNGGGPSTPAVSVPTAVVLGAPAIVKKPRIFGRPKIKHRLNARKGIWKGLPTSYHYEWLRCNAHGRRCRRIDGARYARYRVRKADVGHRLRVRVTALNAVGQKRTISRPSRIVHG